MTSAEQLIDFDRLQQLVQTGTGAGVRIAILDTGVDAAHPALERAVRGCSEVIFSGGRLVCRDSDGGDSVGHGTACAGIIHEIAPEAELHSVRVMGANASGTIEQLTYGLRWAIREGFDIVNLSLGTVQRKQIQTLHDLVDEAYFKGVLLISAANNNRLVSLPAEFAALVAVDNKSVKEPLEFHYLLGRPVEIVANGIYVRAPSPGGKYRWFTGTSFACPHITGLAARLKSEIPDLTPFQLKSLLFSLRANSPSNARPLEGASPPIEVASAKSAGESRH